MKDVAKDAGVSVATVSRYINQSGYISQSAQEKIKKSIDRLGYYPNEIARSLFTQTSKIIGLLVPDIANPYFNSLVKAVEKYASNKGYLVVLADISEDRSKLDYYSKLFSQFNISGMLVTTGEIGEFKHLDKVPKVYMDRIKETKDFCVMNDNSFGGQLIAEVINQTDAKDVLLIEGPRHFQGSKDRFLGVLDNLKEAINVQTDYLDSYNMNSIRTFIKKVLMNHNRFDTVVCPNDITALELLKECSSRNIVVPDQIQIIGYDGIPMTQYTSPTLSTIVQPIDEIGETACQILIDLIEDITVINQKVILTPELAKRESIRSES